MTQQIGESPQCVTTLTNSTHITQLDQNEATRSSYKALDESLKMFKGHPKVLGALQILNGSMIFALGVFLGLLKHTFDFSGTAFFMLYIGYPFWGAAFFITSGSLSVAAGGKPTRNLVQSSFGMNIASATISVVGFIFLSINFVLNAWQVNSCSLAAPNVCTLTTFTLAGILSLMLILTVLEFCITISFTILECKANCCDSNELSRTKRGKI
ncbi:membrane-spanning 4-domains subfamily A member 3 isoform X2 [Vombatus ursinus]|uniref:membrane-spanning 4-domains subfamily A member 3 isoform X2 n=1 Tax=Vombatus ursinus TaxID=29139 RepID=UPI000FFCE766|nr:membrane-spanning 4-domains subfamily A member 3 isoform X2 [Vombatus ursinus]